MVYGELWAPGSLNVSCNERNALCFLKKCSLVEKRLPFDELCVNDFRRADGVGSYGHSGCAGRVWKRGMKLPLYDPVWQPTRLTSPYCVLSGSGMEDDFYTSCVSWGRENAVLALRDEVLFFHPSRPHDSTATMNVYEKSGDVSSKVTSVAVSRFSDSCCFLARLNGAVGTYVSRGDGTLVLNTSFRMPPSLLENTPLSGESVMAATTSVRCLSTTNMHPWMVAAGSASQGLFFLDSRCTKPVARMSGSDLPISYDSEYSRPFLTAGGALSLLSSAKGICGISWNATSSLVATGESGGMVNIWSLSHTRAPVQQIKLPGIHTTIKAISFHPTNPYEIVVGGGFSDGVLRVYDISSATHRLMWSASTGCQVTQALYSPDGAHIVSAQGAKLCNTRAGSMTHQTHMQFPEEFPNRTRGGAVDHTEWLTEQLEHDMMRDGITEEGARESFLPQDELGNSAPNDALFSEEVPPLSLVVWRKGMKHRGSTPMAFSGIGTAVRQRSDYSPRPGHAPLPLLSMYVMSGHRSRPLHLTAPFSQSANHGCVASVAGGVDCTIRFWRCFSSRSEAANWEQRTHASLRAAITDEDVEGIMAMPLR